LNLTTWVDARRPRIFIFCIHVNVGGEDIVREAQALAVSFEEKCQMQPKKKVEECCVVAGSPAWRRVVLGDIGSRGVTVSHPTNSKNSWKKETEAIRKLLQQEGKPWAQAHPLQHAHLCGLQKTERQVELLDCVLLLRCRAATLSPEDPAQLVSARRGLKWDVSQNVTIKNAAALAQTDLACTCIGALVYSYEMDRILHPEEMLQAMDWSTQTRAPSTWQS
jgi:hypothetical protein